MVSFCSQVSNGDLAEAVAFLTEKNAKVPQQDETTYYQTTQIGNDRYISVGSQADTSTYLHLLPGLKVHSLKIKNVLGLVTSLW